MLNMVFSAGSSESFSNNIPMVVFTVLFLAVMTVAVLFTIFYTYHQERNPMSRMLNNNKRDESLHSS